MVAIAAAVLVGFFPHVVGWAVAFLLLWLGVVMGVRATWHKVRARDEHGDSKESAPVPDRREYKEE